MRTAVLAAIVLLASPLSAQLPQGIASGDVTPNSAVVWARSTSAGDVRFVLIEPGAKQAFTGLSPHHRYKYLVIAPNGDRAIGSRP